MLNYASGGLEESKGILEEYQDIYQQAQKAELLSDDRLFKADGREQTASKWLSDYGLEESKGILEEYQDIYQQAQKAELLSDDRLFKADGREQTASKWLSDYAKSIEAYNRAVSEGDNTAITQAKKQFDAIDSAMSGLAEGKMSAYANQIEEVRSQLNEICQPD